MEIATMNRHAILIALAAGWLAHPAPATAQVIQSTLDAVPPPQSEHYVAPTTGQVPGPRLFRDGVPSQCGTAKPNPGPFSNGPYRFDAYTFTAQETRCQLVRLRLLSPTGNVHVQLHSAFDPADATANYLADSGTSVIDPAGRGFAFDVVAGQTYTLVVMATGASSEGAEYELSFDDRLTTVSTSTLDTTPPSGQGPYWNETTSTSGQIPVLAAPPSSCGAAKAAPTTTGVGPYRLDRLRVMSPITTCLTVTLRRLGASGALALAAYSQFSTFDTGWLADSGSYTMGPAPAAVSFSMAVTAGQSFDIVVVNGTASEEGAQYELELSSPVQPPRLFRTTAVNGNTVSFRWVPPLHGPTPTSYVIDGGVAPGQVLATVPLSAVPVATLNAPSGAFYVRARSLVAGSSSAPSNETRIFVNQAVAPSAPSQLLATVSDSAIGLTWANTFAGGQATALALDVTGSATASIPLSASLDRVAFGGVPGGTYNLSLRAVNASGASIPSNVVTVAIPGACPGVPQPPANVLAYRVGNTLTVLWDAPVTGPAPASYTLVVTGSFAGSFSTPGRVLSGAVGAGSYTLAVQSNNACGSSVLTTGQTVVVP
jgi:hypothetical protein